MGTPSPLFGLKKKESINSAKQVKIAIKEEKTLQLNFKLSNKLAFIRDDNLKEEFIQQIKDRKEAIDQHEKEKF